VSVTLRPTIAVGGTEARAARPVDNRLAVAQHGDGVAEREDLLELVADEEDRGAPVAQLPEHVEQQGRLPVGDRRGRLVEQEDRGLHGQRTGDLELLALRDAEVPGPGPRVDAQADPLQPRRGLVVHAREVDEPGPGARRAEVQVLGHRELGHDVALLVHRTDPRGDRVVRTLEPDLLAEHEDAAAVGPVHSGDRLDERRLPCAVLAQERVDAARGHPEVRRRQRGRAVEGLAEPAGLERERL
jgi:hypothetical protein